MGARRCKPGQSGCYLSSQNSARRKSKPKPWRALLHRWRLTGAEAMTREAGSMPECPAAPSAALITGGGLQSSGGTSATSPAVPGSTKSVVRPQTLQQRQSSVPDANRKELCWSCSAEGVRLKKCSRCAVASYCGAACQKADWKAHKGKCAELKVAAVTAANASHH